MISNTPHRRTVELGSTPKLHNNTKRLPFWTDSKALVFNKLDGPLSSLMNDDIPHNKPICKTYIQHEGKWFFVSTIERDSSAPVDPPPRYWETIVWDYDYATGDRGEMLGIFNSDLKNLDPHNRLVAELFRAGAVQTEAE